MKTKDMTDEQINAELVLAIGWEYGEDGLSWMKGGVRVCHKFAIDFATSRDAFHDHVVPVLVEHGEIDWWAEEVCNEAGAGCMVKEETHLGRTYTRGTSYRGVAFALTATPRQLCIAALAVLGEVQDAKAEPQDIG